MTSISVHHTWLSWAAADPRSRTSFLTKLPQKWSHSLLHIMADGSPTPWHMAAPFFEIKIKKRAINAISEKRGGSLAII